MVRSIERFKSALSEHFLRKTRSALDLSTNFFGSAFRDSDARINGVRNHRMALESMFPSLFDGIRRGRCRSDVLDFDHNDTKASNQPSLNVRIIPIIVEGRESEKTTKSKTLNKVNSIILDDEDVSEIIDCTTDDSSTRSTNDINKCQARYSLADKEPIDSPVIIDEEDCFSHFDSSALQKSSKDCHTDDVDRADFRKSGSVEHLESLSDIEKPNWNNIGSREKNVQFTSSAIINDSTEWPELVDCSKTVISGNPECSSKSGVRPIDCGVLELEDNPPPDYPVYDMLTKQLTREHRKIHYITGDGNCFFRALSKILCGTETCHKEVRELIVDIIAKNQSQFAQFVDKENVQDHIKKMSEDCCWATTCEIYAAATVLQRDIFMLTPNQRNSSYSWLLFKPVFKTTQDQHEFPSQPCCITLCNTNGIHYDLVVGDHGKCNCFMPNPELGGINASIDLT